MTSFRININKRQQQLNQYWRVPHDVERMNVNADDFRFRSDGSKGKPREIYATNDLGVRYRIMKPFPEVYRLDPDLHTVLDCNCQWLWRNLNPNLSGSKWSTLLGNKLAWTNGTGFPDHYNCITGAEPTKPYPRFDQNRVCGGAILTGTEVDGKLYIESIRNNQNIPSTSDVLSKPWLWYWGTSVSPDGSTQQITKQGIDGKYYPVRIPIITAVQVTLPLNELHKLPLGELS